LALGPERRNQGGQDDQACIDKEFGCFSDAPDIFNTVSCCKAEIAVEPVAQIIAIKEVGVAVNGKELLLDKVRDRRLAGT
jgi:hypothetical protein